MNYLLLIILVLSAALIFLLVHLLRTTKFMKELLGFFNELAAGNRTALLFTGKEQWDNAVRDIVSMVEKTRASLDIAEAGKQKIEAILRGMSDAMLITDMRGIIILANRSFNRLFSVNENIEGRWVAEVLRDVKVLEMLARVLDSWEVITEELTIVRSNKDVHLIATAVPVYTKDSVSGVVLTLHDITRLRQLEDMRKDFVANVSHEIKTPITAIKGFAEILIDDALNDRSNSMRFLSMIKNHSERLNSLVDDLLTLSRIEFGDIVINKAEVNVEAVIDTVFMTLKDKADRKGLYLKNVVPGIKTVYADRDKLIQIMLNLVDNGIKFTETGGVTVGFQVIENRGSLYVEDTGAGIPQSHINRLGERFYRVDRARSRELGGTGLGLAIVKHLVKAHDWNMTIESRGGSGTRVIILSNNNVPREITNS